MVIGFDAKRALCNGTGLGNYARTLINDLATAYPTDSFRLYTPYVKRDDLRQEIVERDNVRMVLPQGRHTRLSRDLWRIRQITRDLRRDGVSLYHGLSGELPMGINRQGINSVVTIHDLIFLRHPEYYNWIDAQIYKFKFRYTAQAASRIIAISECTKRDILHYSHVAEDQIDVVYQSCGQRFSVRNNPDTLQRVRTSYQLPSRYILHVGTIEARKNILLAVKALASLPTDVHLVIVGRPTPYAQEVRRYIESQRLTPRIHFLQGVPNDDLPAIYQLAEVFVYPSRYEGFGIPIIEAIQSGLPVAACTGSCLEEAGGPHCLYTDPDDIQGMVSSLTALLKQEHDSSDFRRSSIAASRDYIRRFENYNTAEQVYQSYLKCNSLHL